MAPKRTPVKKLFADKESENVQENSPATNQAAAPISKMHQDFMRFLEAQEANREAERLENLIKGAIRQASFEVQSCISFTINYITFYSCGSSS